MFEGSEVWSPARRIRGLYPLDVIFESHDPVARGWRSWGRSIRPWVVACAVHLGIWAAATFAERDHRPHDRVSAKPIQIETLAMPQPLPEDAETTKLEDPTEAPEIQDSTPPSAEQAPLPPPKPKPSKPVKSSSSESREHASPLRPKLLAMPPSAKEGDTLASEPIDLLDLGDYGSKSFEAVSVGAPIDGSTSTRPGSGRGSASAKGGGGRGTNSSQSSRPKLHRPVRLEADQWNCPWPKEAMQADIYKESVVLRVLVRPNGTVEQTHLLEDPGFGFGSAAVQCARRTKFSPALNRKGQAVRALSPAIRVSFVR